MFKTNTMEKLEKSSKTKSNKKRTTKGQKFMVLRSRNIGVNKDGSFREVYEKGKEIILSDKKKIDTLKSLKII